MAIFVVGSLNMDLVVQAPVMPKAGMTVTGNGFMTNAGGKGGNQAAACAKLGGDTRMIGCVGRAFGEELVSALAEAGVDVRFVGRREEVPSGIAVIVVAEGDNRIVLDRGANGCVDEALVERGLEGAGKGDFLLVQLEIGLPAVLRALALGKEKGMTTVLNPAPAAPLPPEAFRDCDYFCPNQTEAEFYTGVYPADGESAAACAERLKAMGVGNVVVTLGAQGAVFVGKDGPEFSPACPAEVVDTTAAGDTFVGAFVVALSEGRTPAEAMAFANRAASFTVSRRGAQCSIPTRSEL